MILILFKQIPGVRMQFSGRVFAWVKFPALEKQFLNKIPGVCFWYIETQLTYIH